MKEFIAFMICKQILRDYEEILSPEARGNHYYQILKNDELYGFSVFFPVGKDKQELGFRDEARVLW